MIKTFRPVLALLFLALASFAAGAQDKADPPKSETQEQLDASVQRMSDRLADIEKRVDVTRPSAALLEKLSTEIAPLVPHAQALVDRLAPRVAAIKARLDQLGPKPANGENAETGKDRDQLQKSFDDTDGLFKRAKVLAVKAQQDASYIAKRQRDLFTISLFQRSTSILSPPLWITVARETPANIADTSRISKAWIGAFAGNLTGGKRITFWMMVVAVLVLYWPARHWLRRLVKHEIKFENPGGWQKAFVAAWTAISGTGLTIAIMYGVVYVFSFFAPPESRLMPLFLAMQGSVIRIAVAFGLARALLAPRRPKWRMLDLDDTTSEKLMRIAIGVAVIVSGAKLIEALNDVIYASLEFSVAARGIGALLVAAALAAALIDLREGDDEETPTSGRRDLFGLLRGLAWALVLVITVAVIVGYIPLGSFLTEQLTLVAATATVLFLSIRLVDEASALVFKPGSRLGRNLIHTVGLRRETLDQLPVILSGGARLVLSLVALLVVAAPWGMQSTDIAGNLHAIFFGFKIGDVTISLAGISVALISFLVVLAITRAVQNWLEDRYLPTTRLDSGLRNSIKTSLGYVGVIVALAIGAENLGVDFQKLAIVAGALSVGIGFGLQSIVNNFVSGLILLWERAVRVGDWVVVGSDQGYVRKINVRSTEIETFDRASVIVPNSNLVSGVVKNLMREDRFGRLNIDLTVHASADPEKVREVLLAIARANDAIASLPAPQVRFTDLTASSMAFTLFCFVADVETMARVKSDLYFEVYRQFREHKFFDGPAAPPTRVDIENLEQLLEAASSTTAAPVRARKAG